MTSIEFFCLKQCYKKNGSIAQNEIWSFLKEMFPIEDIIVNGRKAIYPLELDMYIPSKNFAIEYDGVYWHSSNRSDTPKRYHINKTLMCQKKNIRLIHVLETEWISKKDIVKSIIKSKLGIYDHIIYGRKCELRELTNKEYQEFINLNHVQGYTVAPIRLGLFHNNELVACIGIGKSRFKKDEMEVIRFCNKLNTLVVGGLSKLIKHSGIKELVSYVDLRYFNGSGYEKAGFKFVSQSTPSYVYVKGVNILSRFQCQKHKLPVLLGDKFNSDLTEVENMTLSGYLQIYDCGTLKFVYNN
jgi:hypothetical protein